MSHLTNRGRTDSCESRTYWCARNCNQCHQVIRSVTLIPVHRVQQRLSTRVPPQVLPEHARDVRGGALRGDVRRDRHAARASPSSRPRVARCDYLINTLPSTRATRGLLDGDARAA
eukprot:TRINITY_DN21558_c0_g1_i1.p1 TRINITY_DN21558_c0_g1~~TRINITY_DN21558_c0_g1_i1.p1  ORF type:complete len:116 (-),score=17.10 TRINITY_DN21558_c0_g1_i1:351-698(-)